jgi:hypothetical protein
MPLPEGPGPGRPKGSLNKSTKAVKEALEEAFDELGGVDSLVQWARRDPGEFYKCWVKMLPKNMEVSGKDGEALIIQVITGVPKKDADAGS